MTKIFDVEGMTAEPKRTAVPAGELRTSFVDRAPQPSRPEVTGKTERNPVLLTAGLPLTVVKRTDSSSEKKV